MIGIMLGFENSIKSSFHFLQEYIFVLLKKITQIFILNKDTQEYQMSVFQQILLQL